MPQRNAHDQQQKWLDAEREYGKAVKAFTKTGRSGALTRADVLTLVKARAQADKLRDRYLKVVLPPRLR